MNRTVSPSTTGVRPMMKKMYDGRNVATRPIPIIVDESERRAMMAAAADSRPKVSTVNMPAGPRPKGTDALFGTTLAGTSLNAGVFEPVGGDYHA